MKRDMELVRKILIAIEESPEPGLIEDFAVEGYDEAEVMHHLILLYKAGMIDGQDTSNAVAYSIMPGQMTWAGYEFFDVALNDNVWRKAKDIAAKLGNVSLGMMKTILVSILTDEIKKLMP